jgi:hypothetical protein
MKALVSALVLLFVTGSLAAQQSGPSYISELSFLESSRSDVISLLGPKHKSTAGEIQKKDASGGTAAEKLKTSILQYKNIRGWNRIDVTFLEDKLVEIQYWPKNKSMRAAELPKALSVDFVSVGGFSEKVPISAFEGQKDPLVPKVYGPIYFMVTVQPSHSTVALINNGSLKAIFKDAARSPTVEMYPGFVENIRMTSRSIDRRK